MKRNTVLAIVAAMVFGLGSLAVAQEGYYGQQATTSEPAQQSEPAHPAACCGHMHSPSPASSSVNQQKKGGAASQSEGDPSAPQNIVEYGG